MTPPDHLVPHEDEHRKVIDEQLQRGSDVLFLPDIPAAAAAPTMAEFNALRASHNKVLETLRDSGLIPSS